MLKQNIDQYQQPVDVKERRHLRRSGLIDWLMPSRLLLQDKIQDTSNYNTNANNNIISIVLMFIFFLRFH